MTIYKHFDFFHIRLVDRGWNKEAVRVTKWERKAQITIQHKERTQTVRCVKPSHTPKCQQDLLSADPVAGWHITISLFPKLKWIGKIRDQVRFLHCVNRTSSLHLCLSTNLWLHNFRDFKRFFDSNTRL